MQRFTIILFIAFIFAGIMSEIKITLFGISCIFSTFVGVPGNLISLIHFLKDKEKISSFLYRCISASDLLACLLMIPKISTSFDPEDAGVFENNYFCEIWNFFWKLSYKFSLFAVLMLSAVRSFYLLSPFSPRRSTLIKLITISYLLILALEEILLKVFLKFVSHYDWKFGHCQWLLQLPNPNDMTTMIDPFSDNFKILHTLYWDVQVALPMLLTILSCLVTLVHMVVTSRNQDTDQGNSRSKATGTILAVTITCITFNLPHILIRILDTVSIFTEYKFKWHTDLSPNSIIFLYSFLDAPVFALSAAINPLIYIWRMKEFRVSVGRGMRWFKGKVTRTCSDGSDTDEPYFRMGERKKVSASKTKSSKV